MTEFNHLCISDEVLKNTIDEYLSKTSTEILEKELEFIITKCFITGIIWLLSSIEGSLVINLKGWLSDALRNFMIGNNLSVYTKEEYWLQVKEWLSKLLSAYDTIPFDDIDSEKIIYKPFIIWRESVIRLYNIGYELIDEKNIDINKDKFYKELNFFKNNITCIIDYIRKTLKNTIKDRVWKILEFSPNFSLSPEREWKQLI